MDEHKKFVTNRLLSENRPVTYRLLSRALGIHANTAKGMLYAFYKDQNALKNGSVYATYLVYGIKAPIPDQDSADVPMSGSGLEPEALSDSIPTTTLTLVGEESLADVLREYQEVAAIHIYSLAMHPNPSRSTLTDMAKSISEHPMEQDAAIAAKRYGLIPNPNLCKRNRASRPAILAATAPKTEKQYQATAADKPVPPESHKLARENLGAVPEAPTPTPLSSSGKNAASAAKRGATGGIMQSFAKAALKPPAKPKKTTQKENSDAVALSDDGEAEDGDMMTPKTDRAVAETSRKSRREREEELRRMMEKDDDDDDDDEREPSETNDEEMEEAPEPEPEGSTASQNDVGTKDEEDKGPAEVVYGTGDGRRRGRRRIMKKKRILDDQGYMVTIQEPGWESFSEDEAAHLPAKKATPTPTPTPSSSAVKAKNSATAKGGKGNIMSFFSKK